MPSFTPHLNLELPGGGSLGIGGDDETADIDKLNQDFQKIDTWADATDEKLDDIEEQFVSTSWVPTVTGLTLGNGTMRAFYAKRGLIVEFFIEVVSGSTTSATGTVGFSLPVAIANPSVHRHIGEGYFNYAGTNAGSWPVEPRLAGGSTINACFLDASAGLVTPSTNLSNTFPTTGAWGGAGYRPTIYLHGSYLAIS